MPARCLHCACTRAEGEATHRLLALLSDDDVDAALERGLLASAPCPGCDANCNARLATAREARQNALEARERYRKRAQRVARRKAAHAAARAPASTSATSVPDLPAAAAAALARALAKASGAKTR